MGKHHSIALTTEQRDHLEDLIHKGHASARTHTRARILLLSDRSQGQQRTDAEVAAALLCSKGTIANVRHRFLREGVQAALYDKLRPGQKPKVTADVAAQLTLLACSAPPEGQARWTLRLLAGRLIELGVVETISHVTVREALKKTRCIPGG
jgi:hypothetical protein